MSAALALLSDLRARGVRLVPAGDRLTVDAPRGALTPELLEALRRCKAELLELLRHDDAPDAETLIDVMQRVRKIMPGARLRTIRTPGDTTDFDTGAVVYVTDEDGRLLALPQVRDPDEPAASRSTWDAAALELIGWFRTAREAGTLPTSPFTLHPWMQVADPARWFASLEADIAAGPRGARGRSGALLEELENLRDGMEAR